MILYTQWNILLTDQVVMALSAITKACGFWTEIYFGTEAAPEHSAVLLRQKYYMILWNSDSEDFPSNQCREIIKNISGEIPDRTTSLALKTRRLKYFRQEYPSLHFAILLQHTAGLKEGNKHPKLLTVWSIGA